jgi:hypothetical protein
MVNRAKQVVVVDLRAVWSTQVVWVLFPQEAEVVLRDTLLLVVPVEHLVAHRARPVWAVEVEVVHLMAPSGEPVAV